MSDAFPSITAVRLSGAGRSLLPVLVLGPAPGTSATDLWGTCATDLIDHFDVVAWDLPGHGHNTGVAEEPFTVEELARGVLTVVDDVLDQRGEHGGTFCYAGDSVGGAVGLQLLLDAPTRIDGAVLLATGARLGGAAAWKEQTAAARASRTSEAGFAQACAALEQYDVRERLGEIRVPVLAIAGAQDQGTPVESLAEIADGVRNGRLVVLPDIGHPAPVDAPAEVAALLRQHLLGEEPPLAPPAPSERHEAGMAVRREVLGDAHVDRAIASATDLSDDFDDLVTDYAWGAVWARPGLDRRSRSLITLTALVATGHLDDLAVHLRAARRLGLSVEEIKECLLQTAVYCGLPAARAAFRIADEVLASGHPESDS